MAHLHSWLKGGATEEFRTPQSVAKFGVPGLVIQKEKGWVIENDMLARILPGTGSLTNSRGVSWHLQLEREKDEHCKDLVDDLSNRLVHLSKTTCIVAFQETDNWNTGDVNTVPNYTV